jgi:hypothetical protein
VVALGRVSALLSVALALGAHSAAADTARPCASHIELGVVPAWARTGFSEPRPRTPHVLGEHGRIAALVFGYPLLSPAGAKRANKILWVSRVSPEALSDLRIVAQRMVGARAVGPAVRRTVAGGPGPSIVDLPKPGCWRLGLRWSGRADTLDLQYLRNG